MELEEARSDVKEKVVHRARPARVVTKIVEKEVPGPERIKYVDRIEYKRKIVVVEKPVEVMKELIKEEPKLVVKVVERQVEVVKEVIKYRDGPERIVYRDNPKHIEMIRKFQGHK